MIKDGAKHIQKLMHVFIEGIAAGIYDNLDDIQADACEYLNMERAVDKLSNWNKDSKIEDLAEVFDGVSRSMESRRHKAEEQKEWDDMMKMPCLSEDEYVFDEEEAEQCNTPLWLD